MGFVNIRAVALFIILKVRLPKKFEKVLRMIYLNGSERNSKFYIKVSFNCSEDLCK